MMCFQFGYAHFFGGAMVLDMAKKVFVQLSFFSSSAEFLIRAEMVTPVVKNILSGRPGSTIDVTTSLQ